jgi:hypothetical protein
VIGYFIKILSIDNGVIIPATQRPDGKEIHIHFLKEGEGIGLHGDFDQLNELTDRKGVVVVQNQAGGIITGREIYLDDIVGWAIEHGYLEDLVRAGGVRSEDRHLTDGSVGGKRR